MAVYIYHQKGSSELNSNILLDDYCSRLQAKSLVGCNDDEFDLHNVAAPGLVASWLHPHPVNSIKAWGMIPLQCILGPAEIVCPNLCISNTGTSESIDAGQQMSGLTKMFSPILSPAHPPILGELPSAHPGPCEHLSLMLADRSRAHSRHRPCLNWAKWTLLAQS
jgi:hypothetical protein